MKISPVNFKGSVSINRKTAARHIASIKNEEIKENLILNLRNFRQDLRENTPDTDNYKIKILTGYYTDIVSPNNSKTGTLGHGRYFVSHDLLCDELNDYSFKNTRQNIERKLKDGASGEFLDIEVIKNGKQDYRKTILLSNTSKKKTFVQPKKLKKQFKSFLEKIKNQKGNLIRENPYIASNIDEFEKQSKKISYHTPSYEELIIAERL